jgi:hypothetical protein
MEYDLNFEVLSIKFDLYSGYNLDSIQHKYLNSASLELYYLDQHYHGLHYYWKKTLLFLKFGEIDRVRTATTKFRSLQQGSRPASVYVADFYQLICDVDWDDNAIINAFRWKFRDDVKDLFLNLPNPLTLTEAITQAV